jgi:regulator of sigma E protease
MEEATPSATSFASKSAWRRIAILCAGVFMNVVVAIILLSVQAGVGSPTVVTDANEKSLTDFKTYIVQVTPATPAAESGIKELDRIVRIDQLTNPTLTQAQQYITGHAGSQISIEVERTGQHLVFNTTPRQNPPAGQGALGISLAETGLIKVPWWQAPWVGLQRTWQLFITMMQQLGIVLAQLFRTHTVSQALTGPVGIAVYTNEATKLGFSYVLEFGALISLNLAVINILPLPALDGGRILFVIIELLRGGKRVPQKYEQWTHTIGFALLIALMLLITLRDIGHYYL